jgi:CAAX prenyl protease-like protein
MYDALPRALPFAVLILALALRQRIGASLGTDARWLYAIQALGASGALAVFAFRCRELAIIPVGRHVLAAFVLGVVVLALWVAPMPHWASLTLVADAGYVAMDGGQVRWDFVVLRTGGAALVVPLAEELFWRSFVMRWIDRKDFLALAPADSSTRALVLSSIAFGLEHELWAAGIAAGFAYGLLYRWSGNLWVAIAAHATTNLGLAFWVVGTHQWEYW